LADFEGEFTGLEGELISAAFQQTWAIDPKGLRQMPCGKEFLFEMGLLIDLRFADGVKLTKRLMESETVSKIIWGADGDVTCLRHTPLLKPLDIHSTQVVDIQLAFSSPKQRLGMATMLDRLPPESVAGLPNKSVIDFDTPHARNCRALELPFGVQEATYAVDDLHRLDAILRSQKPDTGCYLAAQSQTSIMVSMVLNNVAGASMLKMQQYARMLANKTGVKRQVIAVRIRRHLIALRRIGPDGCCEEFSTLEKEAIKTLDDAGVSIPQDLSFQVASAVISKMAVDGKVSRRAKKRKKKRRTADSAPCVQDLCSGDADATIPIDTGRKDSKRKRRRSVGSSIVGDSVEAVPSNVSIKERSRKMNVESPSGENASEAVPIVAGKRKKKRKRVVERPSDRGAVMAVPNDTERKKKKRKMVAESPSASDAVATPPIDTSRKNKMRKHR